MEHYTQDAPFAAAETPQQQDDPESETTASRLTSATKPEEEEEVQLVFPRGRKHTATQNPVALTKSLLEQMFDRSLADASHQLGICQTAIKKACRKFGIQKWPYRSPNPGPKKAKRTAMHEPLVLASSSPTPPLPASNPEIAPTSVSEPSLRELKAQHHQRLPAWAHHVDDAARFQFFPAETSDPLDWDSDPFWKNVWVPHAVAFDALSDLAPVK
jgi:hypothetical protein